MMRTSASLLRAGVRASSLRTSTTVVPRAAASTHAISNPTLANIEKRWEGMPPTEQAELWMALRDRMKENWAELTLQEKRAGAYYGLFITGKIEL
jgi:cytochrome c oxidase subunit 4